MKSEQTNTPFYKLPWVYITLIFGVISALFFNERHERIKAQTDLENEETSRKSTIISDKLDVLKDSLSAEEKHESNINKEHDKVKSDASNMTKEQALEFYKKNGIS